MILWRGHTIQKQLYIGRSAGPIQQEFIKSDFPAPVRAYARLDLIRDSAKLIEADTTYVLQGEKRPAYLLEVIPRPTEQTAGQSVSMILWVDKEHYLVLQERTTTFIPNTTYGSMSIRQTTSYTAMDIDGILSDFSFCVYASRFRPASNTDRTVSECTAFTVWFSGGGIRFA